MHTLPISVIILASELNSKLVRAIASVSWANEILVVWLSSEKMPHFEANIKVIQGNPQVIDFSEVRNRAANSAINDTVFYLDSDEEFRASSLSKLSTLIERSDWRGATIKRKDIFLNRELNWGEVKNVQISRIFKKGTFQFERPVHEVAVIQGKKVEGEVVISHYAHDSIFSFLNKVIRYVQLEVELRKKANEHVSVFSLIAWPIGKFLSNYFFKLGFLDGWRGLIYATIMSVHSFSLRANLYESNHSAQK